MNAWSVGLAKKTIPPLFLRNFGTTIRFFKLRAGHNHYVAILTQLRLKRVADTEYWH